MVTFLTKLESQDTLEAWVLAKLGWTDATHGDDGEFSPALLEKTKSKLREFQAERDRKAAEEAARKEAEMNEAFEAL